MDLATRKRLEACRRLASFDAELKRWCDESREGSGFQRHGSQIRAIGQMLQGLRVGIGELVAVDPIALDACVEASRLALALFGVWDFFRSKLDQRRNPAYAGALRMADELAWACYEPVRRHGVKEPPLVFFNGGTSPFILRRDVSFSAEGVPRELLGTETIDEVTSRLPFPVIGVPWTQIDHLPDALVISHEVGHAVEADLGLGEDLDLAIKSALAGADRLPYWLKWRSEIFADLYGCHALGPAYACALGDFLAKPDGDLLAERPSMSSSYPPVAVRMCFAAAVLESIVPAAGKAFWSDRQPASPACLAPFMADAPEVAGALCRQPMTALRAKPIGSLIAFTEERLAAAESLARNAAQENFLAPVSDVPVLFAAVRAAYDKDPGGYDKRRSEKIRSTLERLQERVVANVGDVYRAGEQAYSWATQKDHDQAHRDRGTQLLEVLRVTVRKSYSAEAGAAAV